MDFAVGDQVLVMALNRRGEVVERRGQVYRVAVGVLTLTCRDAELRAAGPAAMSSRKQSRTHRGGRPAAATPTTSAHDPRSETSSSIDLHGMTTIEAREALLRHIDEAMRAGHARVEVVHGIGTGKVRTTVLGVLRDIPSVRHVRAHPSNRGVTLVEF